eukprot:TRINITY_DN28542_c0_g1_i2.p1 TRINITY_DN28542_c0_g1~~TRINITY_DN28542_c0_g1_i2.p1  ORF type:complete len:365 (-),score=54.67 TRINITY_DN28542_c0_g1_i2:668-1762(-)
MAPSSGSDDESAGRGRRRGPSEARSRRNGDDQLAVVPPVQSASSGSADAKEVLSNVSRCLRQAQRALDTLGFSDSADGKDLSLSSDNLSSLMTALDAVTSTAASVAVLVSDCANPSTRSSNKPDESSKKMDDKIQDFLDDYNLDLWLGDILGMLSPSQLDQVIGPALNMDRARNPSGVVMSRIKNVASIDKRMQMFIKVNDLAESVVDRISTLTPEQCESVLDSGLKLQKATNPSGVAMARITEAIRREPTRTSKSSRKVRVEPVSKQGAIKDAMDPCGLFGEAERSRSRSPSRRRGGDKGGGLLPLDGPWPSDVTTMVEDLGLEKWCGDVMKRLQLRQRQEVCKELGDMKGVRNPSGVVISRV